MNGIDHRVLPLACDTEVIPGFIQEHAGGAHGRPQLRAMLHFSDRQLLRVARST